MYWYVLALFLVGYTAQAADDTSFTSYQDSAGKVIHLATEETHPLLFQGWRVNQNHHEKHEKKWQLIYRSGNKEYSSVRNCLPKKSRDLKNPSLTMIDWEKIDTNEDAEIGLFRIASSYATPKDMKAWMKAPGFQTAMFQPVKSDIAQGPDISGFWPTKQNWRARRW